MYDFMQKTVIPELKFSCCAAEAPFQTLDGAGWTPTDCHPGLWVLECFSGPGIGFRTESSAERPWRPDQWNLYPPGMKYAVRFREPERQYENLWLLFQADPAFPHNRVTRFHDPEKSLWQKVRELHCMRLAGDGCPAELRRMKLCALLAELEMSSRRAGEGETADFVRWDAAAARSDTLLQRTDWILQEHLRRPPTVAELAEMLGMSVSSYSHKLRQESGWTPVARIRHVRIEQAKKLLRQSLPRTAIRNTVWHLGFRSRQYFNCVFKRETGMTPGEFLRSGR